MEGCFTLKKWLLNQTPFCTSFSRETIISSFSFEPLRTKTSLAVHSFQTRESRESVFTFHSFLTGATRLSGYSKVSALSNHTYSRIEKKNAYILTNIIRKMYLNFYDFIIFIIFAIFLITLVSKNIQNANSYLVRYCLLLETFKIIVLL